nr:retrotransposon protein, putative, Ty1-copia subclass [Tanacetum cinerariifolium]
MDGKVHIYKARLVAKGYTQTYGVDYKETFTPVIDIRAIRIVIAIEAYYDYEIWKVCSIMYDVRCIRPAVAFVQNITSRFQQNSGEAHSTAVKNILKYLRNTKDTFLVFDGDREADIRVNYYCDAGFETDRDDTKSQIGYIFILNGGAVMNCDNSDAIIMAKELRIQKGTRRFKRKYHYVRECIGTGEIDIVKVHTDENLVGPFTKALASPKLTRHARSMGLRPATSVVVNGSTFHTSALFQSSKATKDDVAAIAFSHYSTFSLPIAEMKNLKKLKLNAMGSCSNKDKGALKETAMEITPPDLAVPTTNEPDLNKSVDSYLLCNKVRVYTSIPDAVLPKGSVVLPLAEGNGQL